MGWSIEVRSTTGIGIFSVRHNVPTGSVAPTSLVRNEHLGHGTVNTSLDITFNHALKYFPSSSLRIYHP